MKKKGEKRGIYMLIFSILIAIFLISLASAGFSDWLKKSITGKVPQNMSISVAGINPAQIVYVSQIPQITPQEFSFAIVTFEVHMYDRDGVKDLNKTSVSAKFGMDGETTRTTDICYYQNDLPPREANFSCSIDMWYWDGAGDWNISVKGKDIGNGSWVYNTSTTFHYNIRPSMIISPEELIWPDTTPGVANQTPSIPTIINNTGNYKGNVSVEAISLSGETNSSEAIYAEDFTADTDNTLPECDGTPLSNYVSIQIIGSNSDPGNLSAGGGQEKLYYCIPQMPLISSQTYSTKTGGSWYITYT